MLIGMALMTAACLMFLPGGLYWVVLGLAIAGIGQGFAFNTSSTAAMDAVPVAKSGTASGVLNAAPQLGSTLGIAGAGAIFQTIESRGLLAAVQRHANLDADHVALVRALFSGSAAARSTLAGLAPTLRSEVQAVIMAIFDASFRGAMLLRAIVSLAGLAISLSVSRSGAAAAR
jgi:hypothetical protein